MKLQYYKLNMMNMKALPEPVTINYVAVQDKERKIWEQLYSKWETDDGIEVSEGCVKEIQLLQDRIKVLEENYVLMDERILKLETELKINMMGIK